MSRPGRRVVHRSHQKTPQYVYRLRDSAGRLLYVGTTWNLAPRMAQHRLENPVWWAAVASMDSEEFADRQAAEEAEQLAIAAERPAINVMHGAERAQLRADRIPLRTVAVEDEPWILGLRVAQVRGESLNDVVRAAVAQYAGHHRHLLDERGDDQQAQ